MVSLPRARFLTCSTPRNIISKAETKFVIEFSLKPCLTQNKFHIISVSRFALLLNDSIILFWFWVDWREVFSITEKLFSLWDYASPGWFNKLESEFDKVALSKVNKLRQAFKLTFFSESSRFLSAPTSLDSSLLFFFAKFTSIISFEFRPLYLMGII